MPSNRIPCSFLHICVPGASAADPPPAAPHPRTHDVQLQLTASPASGRLTHRWTCAVAHGLGVRLAASLEGAAAVTSELVADAVRRGAASVVVTLSDLAQDLFVSVTELRSGDGDLAGNSAGRTMNTGLVVILGLTATSAVLRNVSGSDESTWCLLEDAVTG